MRTALIKDQTAHSVQSDLNLCRPQKPVISSLAQKGLIPQPELDRNRQLNKNNKKKLGTRESNP